MEIHPYLRFPKQSNNAKYLILGSIPPPRFCKENPVLEKKDVDFFYGSADNAFWKLFIQAMNLSVIWPDDNLHLQQWIIDNHWAVSDIVFHTERKKNTANDADLNPLKWNIDIIDEILKENPIQHIFFTSKWVCNNFKSKVLPRIKSFNADIQTHVLISPSRSGLRRTNWAQLILPRLNEESLSEYRIRYYKTLFSI